MADNACLRPNTMMKLKRKKCSSKQRVVITKPYNKISKRASKQIYCHSDELEKKEAQNPFKTSQGIVMISSHRELNLTESSSNSILSQTKISSKEFKDILSSEKSSDKDTSQIGHLSLPTDWSLKTHLKILTMSSLQWTTKSQLKSLEEVEAIRRFTADDSGPVVPALESRRVKLQQYLTFWTHPYAPWLQTFPRNFPSVSKADTTVLKQDAIDSMMNEWATSFESLFGMLKSGLCLYFYLCAHTTTVLFRHDKNILRADMVPTTYGVRNTLQLEDVEFTMPLAPESDNDETEDLDSGDPRDFLKSIGIDSGKYESLDPNKVKIQAINKLNIDHSKRSLVCVTGSHTQGLFNYLLNSKNLVPPVGELAGLPPTLLSPSPFINSTIRTCTTKTGSSQSRQPDGSMRKVHYLNITGPLLPSNISKINTLLRSEQEQFSESRTLMHQSDAFNTCVDNVLTSKSKNDIEQQNSDDMIDISDTISTISDVLYENNFLYFK